MNLIELAAAFKQARIGCRRTQRDVANATGVGVITISKFERGALNELGAVKLLAMLGNVGLDLQARPVAQRRTLDDLAAELDRPQSRTGGAPPRQRVRHARKAGNTG